MIELKNFSIEYQDSKKILDNVNLNIQSGEFVCILGASGSGKSTLLRAIGGLIPYQGQALLPGPSSMVFQNANLLPWLSVSENILLPYRLQKDSSDRSLEVLQLLRQLNLKEEVANYFPYQLSGGMKMRVATARALVTKPNLVLMDEAFSSLDEWTRESLQELVFQLWHAHRMTIFFVTHSLIEALSLGQKILVIQGTSLVEYQPLSDSRFFQLDPKGRIASVYFQSELHNLKEFVFQGSHM